MFTDWNSAYLNAALVDLGSAPRSVPSLRAVARLESFSKAAA